MCVTLIVRYLGDVLNGECSAGEGKFRGFESTRLKYLNSDIFRRKRLILRIASLCGHLASYWVM